MSGPTPASTTPDPGAAWLADILGIALPGEGGAVDLAGRRFVQRSGMLREERILSADQAQTADVFGFKWRQRDTFETEGMRAKARTWMIEKYGDIATAPWWDEYGPEPLVVDAGCGASLSALELFGERLHRVRYLGVDVSDSIETAADRFRARGIPAAFLQADVSALPLERNSVDVIFSEGVLHHTDSTEHSLKQLSSLLKPGGRFMFYVYRTKAPVREFTDDYIRERLQGLPPDEAWSLLLPLSRLGQALGELDVHVDVPEDVELLGIPAGRISIHRLLYWYFFKAFHHEDLSLEEMNHINFDWYAPRNAHRQTPEQVRQWCGEAGLEIERENLEPSGITIVARRG